MTRLGEKVLALHQDLEAHGIRHAIGGAIALAYAVERARATNDVDINAFISIEHADQVLGALPPGVRVRASDAKALRRDGQVRLLWDEHPVDLFLSTVELHEVAATRTREVPFEGAKITILSATDLAICKSIYGRPQDWVDLEAMRDVGTIDEPETLRWVAKMLGPEHQHYRRLREILTTPPAPSGSLDRFPPALRPRAHRGARGRRAT